MDNKNFDYHRMYYKIHREEILEKRRQKYKNDKVYRDSIKANSVKWRKNHLEKARAISRNYQHKHADEIKEQKKEYRKRKKEQK